MKVKFDFVAEAWIRNLEIDADSLEEAEQELRSMSLKELEECGYVKSLELKEVESEVTQKTFVIKCYDIIVDDLINDEETKIDKEYEIEITLNDHESEDDLDDLIKDEIVEMLLADPEYWFDSLADFDLKDFKFEVLQEK